MGKIEVETPTAEMSLQVIENVQKFVWNFDNVKNHLSSYIEKYTGLVVTDENLKDMEKTQKEIASLRTKIGKFRLEVKREMEKPYTQFELQIRELASLVESVEKPIKDQLEIYEIKRREEKRAMVQGIEEKYSSQIVIADKYLNRTTTKKEITEDVQMKAAWFLDIQTKAREAEFFKAQKVEMAKFMCQSLSVGLATPLAFEEIESRIDAMDIIALKAHIENEVARRKEREERAAQLAIERAERAKAEAERQAEQARIEAESRVEQAKLMEMATEIKPEQVKKYNAQFVIYTVTLEDIERVKSLLAHNEIKFKFAVKEV